MNENSRPTSLIDLDFSNAEMNLLSKVADADGLTIQQFLREASADYARDIADRLPVKRTVTLPATEVPGFPFFLRISNPSGIWDDDAPSRTSAA